MPRVTRGGGAPTLPARLPHAGDHPVERKIAEADSAKPELPQKRARAPATAAAVVLPHLKLRLALRLLHHCLAGHTKTLRVFELSAFSRELSAKAVVCIPH